MKKQDLKPGMVLKLKSGDFYLIADYSYVLVNLKGGHFNSGLIHSNGVEYVSDLFIRDFNDVLKVYSDYTCSNLLWERKVKPSFIIDEINLLRFIQRYHDRKYDYEWIARDEDGELYVYVNRPEKSDDHWRNNHHLGDLEPIGAANPLRPFNDMFKFIKWEDEEPYSISELLKGANY